MFLRVVAKCCPDSGQVSEIFENLRIIEALRHPKHRKTKGEIMSKILYIGSCGALFGAIGFSVGHLLKDTGGRLLLETGAGAAGIVFGCASTFVWHHWQTTRRAS